MEKMVPIKAENSIPVIWGAARAFSWVVGGSRASGIYRDSPLYTDNSLFPSSFSCKQRLPLNLPYVDFSVNHIYLRCYVTVVDSGYQKILSLQKMEVPCSASWEVNLGGEGLRRKIWILRRE